MTPTLTTFPRASILRRGLKDDAIQRYKQSLCEVHTRLAAGCLVTLSRGDRTAHAAPMDGLFVGYSIVRTNCGPYDCDVMPTPEASVAVVDWVMGVPS
jgi:hypothetical protein